MDQLKPIPLVTPGFKGLNKTQASVTDLDTGWAIECQNFIFDQTGRLACRQGWAKVTVTPLSGTPAIASQGELALANGTSFVVSAANNKIYSGTATLTDITGSLTITANNWQWVTFNGAIYGIQTGHPLIKWNGTGNFAIITPSSGTVPTGGSCGVAAFGRLWILGSDNQTLSYCDLLTDAAWATTGAGSINMGTVWTRGIDAVVGIGVVGAKLVVFGSKQIVLFYDSSGTAVIGLNPQNIAVYDTIEGTGLLARDTIQSTGTGDLLFLSPTGVQSLSRLISSGKDNPVNSLDAQIRDYLAGYLVNEPVIAIRSVYNYTNRFYLLLLPVAQRIFCYDTRLPLPDGSLRVTEWPGQTITSFLSQKNGVLLYGEAGIVGSYGGYFDNLKSYTLLYNSPYIALANVQDQSGTLENRQKILKLMKAVVFYGGSTNLSFSWGVDFQGLSNSFQFALTGVLSEYGTAQYNINEYGGGTGLTILRCPLSGSGRWLQFGMAGTIFGYQVAIQQIDAFAKIGNVR